jgi:hypothetical protein
MSKQPNDTRRQRQMQVKLFTVNGQQIYIFWPHKNVGIVALHNDVRVTDLEPVPDSQLLVERAAKKALIAMCEMNLSEMAALLMISETTASRIRIGLGQRKAYKYA